MYRMNLLRKAAGVILCCSMVFSMACTSMAALDSGVKPVVDEAYYVTTDYYGNPTEAGVVKSYDLNGATEIVDHGTYDSVSNLTNAVQPVISGGEVSFENVGGKAYVSCNVHVVGYGSKFGDGRGLEPIQGKTFAGTFEYRAVRPSGLRAVVPDRPFSRHYGWLGLSRFSD